MTKRNLQKNITVQVIIHALTSKRGICDDEKGDSVHYVHRNIILEEDYL